MSKEQKLISYVLTGPTACGKTELSLEIAEALNCEIVCMDSMQIYRGMDIGTAKPGKAETDRVPHHMLSFLDPRENYSVSQYQQVAERVIAQLHERGKSALFVGGTTLYLRALCHPLSLGGIGSDEDFRNEMRQIAQTDEGKRELHRRLEKVDPSTAARLHENDVRRVIRALEVYRLTGVPLSAQPPREDETAQDFRVAAVYRERSVLYERVNRRVDVMIRDGLEREVRELMARGVNRDHQSMQGLGYKEMIAYLNGECSLEKAIELIRTGTRHYAKRQMTFLKSETEISWFDLGNGEARQDIMNFFTTGGKNE